MNSLRQQFGGRAPFEREKDASFLFVWFLDRNNCLHHSDGTRRLADSALVALTLLIAESKPEDRGTMVTLVVNLINQDN